MVILQYEGTELKQRKENLTPYTTKMTRKLIKTVLFLGFVFISFHHQIKRQDDMKRFPC